MLERDPVRRPRDAGEVLAALGTFEQELRRSSTGKSRIYVTPPAWKRWSVVIPTAAAVSACVLMAWYVHREWRVRWAREEALPQVARLFEQGKYSAAFILAVKVEQAVPKDPSLLELWPQLSRIIAVETTPEGADVYVKEYSAPDSEWRYLGRSPVAEVRLPFALHRLRIEKKGFAPIEVVPGPPFVEIVRTLEPYTTFGVTSTGARIATLRFTLDEASTIPADMVHVPGSSVSPWNSWLERLPRVQLGDYLIDRTEVTNRQYKRFVDAGGYQRRDYWRHDFVKDGRALPWEDGVALFRDRSGLPGPATWASGDYPEGEGDMPVTGISWYEASAYAAFIGKALPNVYQWARAAGVNWVSEEFVPLSNFGGRALVPVGSHHGLGPFGTYGMGGNAKEWCLNASGTDRYILGGAWDEPFYTFNLPDARSPFVRASNFGFRLVKALDGKTAPAASDPIPWFLRDLAAERPADAEAFRSFMRLYAYDRAPLNARVEATVDTSEWHKERVTFAAAYGDERVIAYLFTPRHRAPPYQTVVFFPGVSALYQRSSEELTFTRFLGPILRSGRAILYPVYKWTYERGGGGDSAFASPTAPWRDDVIQWSKDLGRSIDYVETRKELDPQRVALYGVAFGGDLVPLLAAVEGRVKVGILVGGGLWRSKPLPEVDPFNFAPYARQPMLMVNGRVDFRHPLATRQMPLFELLGSPAKDKRHALVEGGNIPPTDVVTKEVLPWLDRYFGPVE